MQHGINGINAWHGNRRRWQTFAGIGVVGCIPLQIFNTNIAMPGIDAIDAVMHPDTTPYLFFVARGDRSGRHVFSVNNAQHEAAVDQYQRKKKQKK